MNQIRVVVTTILNGCFVNFFGTVQAQQPIPIYTPGTGHLNVNTTSLPVTSAAQQNGSSCTLLTFEGLGDLASIPTFQGVSLPAWLSIIQNTAGGSGNFAGEPSPVTIAFWLYGNPTSQTIQVPNGASLVSLYYSSYYATTINAYDGSGTLLTSVTGPPNFDNATSVYDIWSPLQVMAPTGKTIKSLTVTGYANYTGIDNLNVCQATDISSVEITQAIQQYQTLDDLKASLQASGEPPVPIISNKPAVMRVYFKQVQDVTNVTVHLTGVSDQTKTIAVQPNCTDENQRGRQNGCQSMDFYFNPPSGAWQATLANLDGSGTVLSENVLNVISRDTNSLLLRGVSVCDSKDNMGKWVCQSPTTLLGKTTLLSKIAPTSSVALDITSNTVREDLSLFPSELAWFTKVSSDTGAYFGLLDSLTDFFSGRRTTYYGQVRTNLPSGAPGAVGGVGIISSHGAASRASAVRIGTETNVEVIAHETGHTLGLKHTNTMVPAAGAPPGCYNLAQDPSTDWRFGNNYIQSTARLEYGYDVLTRTVFNPNTTFDVMSYCTPRWVSPQRYKTMINTLGGGSVSSSSAVTQRGGALPAATTQASFWQVRGTIQNNVVQFAPLFQLSIQSGNTGAGAGTYSLVELSSAGSALFTRLFTPISPATETTGPDVTGTPEFSETIPVQTGVAAIIVKNSLGAEIGRLTLGGTAPRVSIVSPSSGFVGTGTQTVSWTAQSSVTSTLTSKVLYSADGGATWSGLGDALTDTTLAVEFDALPGTIQGVIQILVSDGINTGSATSVLFTVPKKKPSLIAITNPSNNAVLQGTDPVILSGTAYDVDDGVLSGTALRWSSDVQGSLGIGAQLTTRLQLGNHMIKLTGTDSDGNAVSSTVSVFVAGAPPVVALQVQPLDQAPTTCENATITAVPGANGAPLSLAQYSVDGGTNYITIPLSSLPYKFIVPGSGFLHVVARAYDTSGQYTATDTSFVTQSSCQTGQPVIQGVVSSKGLQPPGVYTVTVTFTNVGSGLAKQATVNVSAQRLSGSGTITYTGTNPVQLPGLSPGQSTSVQLSFAVPNPNTITRFSIAESGTLVNAFNATAAFSSSQQVIP